MSPTRFNFARKHRAHVLTIVLFGVLAAVQLTVLRSLSYSRASLRTLSAEKAARASDPLMLNDLDWHPERYAVADSLQPIRAVVADHCPGRAGYQLAVCLTDLFARQFPHGMPTREFFDKHHDPVAVFQAHLAGEPGHCVSRSGMLAVALLATGTPARVVQILDRAGVHGHNVVEVWDAGSWRLLDPTFARSLEAADGKSSALDMRSPPFPRWRHVPERVPGAGVIQAPALQEYAEGWLQQALLVYPEPWLYTRVGPPLSAWPFRGRFLMVGDPTLRVGRGQMLLQAGAGISLMLGLGILLSLLNGLRSGLLSSLSRRRRTAIHAETEIG
jgi:hypothetical protein